MEPMIVLTVKKDGGTQDVLGFYPLSQINQATQEAFNFLFQASGSRRAIARIELYNPIAPPPENSNAPL